MISRIWLSIHLDRLAEDAAHARKFRLARALTRISDFVMPKEERP